MTLASGSQLGPYEILGPIGAGGMGEVYRARDPRLDRDVAIKVLPAHLSADPTLRERLETNALRKTDRILLLSFNLRPRSTLASTITHRGQVPTDTWSC